jgi:predicted HicB family RNase H-like nuclease
MKGGVKHMQISDKMKRFTFRVPSDLHLIIKEQAINKGVSVNAFILQILWDWLRNKQQKARK